MGVKALGYVVIETTDADKWQEFLCDVAGVMRGADAADGAAQYRIDERQFRFRIEQGARERFKTAGYAMADRAALDALAAAVTAGGRPVDWFDAASAAARCAAAGFATSDPAGNGLEFYVGSADEFAAPTPFESPQGVAHFITGEMGMGHAVFSAPNFAETLSFYRDIVGFRETDMPVFHLFGPEGPPMHFAFLHADNGRHHSLAFAEGPVPPSGAVHVMLEYPSLDEVGKAHDRMKALGYAESATIGRHHNDETVGFYVQTPGGFDLEIGHDSLVIDPVHWQVTQHQGISIWGHEWAWQKAAAAEAAQ